MKKIFLLVSFMSALFLLSCSKGKSEIEQYVDDLSCVYTTSSPANRGTNKKTVYAKFVDNNVVLDVDYTSTPLPYWAIDVIGDEWLPTFFVNNLFDSRTELVWSTKFGSESSLSRVKYFLLLMEEANSSLIINYGREGLNSNTGKKYTISVNEIRAILRESNEVFAQKMYPFHFAATLDRARDMFNDNAKKQGIGVRVNTTSAEDDVIYVNICHKKGYNTNLLNKDIQEAYLKLNKSIILTYLKMTGKKMAFRYHTADSDREVDLDCPTFSNSTDKVFYVPANKINSH